MWFSKNILLDEDAFEKAVKEFSELSKSMKTFEKEIQSLLAKLKEGFNTPAGAKFTTACENGLLKALEDQANVIGHVSENLGNAKHSYQSVFQEYAQLNAIIEQSQY